MKCLVLEASASAASCALLEDEKVLGEFFVNIPQTHSQTLLPMVRGLLDTCGTSAGEVDLYAVTRGPGSFTGLRIAMAAVKGLAMAAVKPCVGVSTLEALARNLAGAQGSAAAVMDARCGQVYNAMFRVENGALHRLTEDRALAIAALEEECKGYGLSLILAGDGAALCHQTFSSWGARLMPEPQRYQQAASVAFLGQQQAEKGLSVPAAALVPVYLRPPQAERELKRKKEREESK